MAGQASNSMRTRRQRAGCFRTAVTAVFWLGAAARGPAGGVPIEPVVAPRPETRSARSQATQPAQDEVTVRRLIAANEVAKSSFEAGDYEWEVAARAAIVRLMVELDASSHDLAVSRQWAASARRASALRADEQARLTKARRAYSAGNRLFDAGRHAEALFELRPTAEVAKELLGVDAFAAEAAIQRGAACLATGELDEAADSFEWAVKASAALYGDRHPRVGHALSYLAAADARRGHLDVASREADRAFMIEKTAAGRPVDSAVAHLNLARARLACKRPSEAEQEAVAAAGLVGPRDTDDARVTYLHARMFIAASYVARDRYAAARVIAAETLAEAAAWPETASDDFSLAELKRISDLRGPAGGR